MNTTITPPITAIAANTPSIGSASRLPRGLLPQLLAALALAGLAGCHQPASSLQADAVLPPPPPAGPCDANHQEQALALARIAAQKSFGGTVLGRPTATFGPRFTLPQLPGQAVPTPSYGWYVKFPVEIVLNGVDDGANPLAIHLMAGLPQSGGPPPSTSTAPALVPGRIAEALPQEASGLPETTLALERPAVATDLRPANARTVSGPLMPPPANGQVTQPTNVEQAGAATSDTAISRSRGQERRLDGALRVFVSVEGRASIL